MSVESNILTLANTTELVKSVIREVGYDFQARLEDEDLDELVTSSILELVKGEQK